MFLSLSEFFLGGEGIPLTLDLLLIEQLNSDYFTLPTLDISEVQSVI